MRIFLLCIGLCWLWPALSLADDTVRVRLLASNLRPYIGESLVLTMEIIRPEMLRQALSPVWPKMADLAVEESLPSVVRRTADAGDPRIVESLRRVVRPLRTGTILLEQAAVSVGDQRRMATPLKLSIRPLPTIGQPANFSGAVGRVETELDMAGSGRREISLLLRGAADLRSVPSPLVAGQSDRLVLLTDENRGRWPKRERWLHYLLIPGDSDTGELQLRLSWFDPASASYGTATDGGEQKKVSTIGVGLALAGLFGLLWLGQRLRRYRLLAADLKQKKRVWPEQQILARLRQAGAAEALLQEIQHFWRQRESAFAPEHQDGPPTPVDLPIKLAWKLSARIDKRALHQP